MEILKHAQANACKYTPKELSQKPQEVQDNFRTETTKLIRCLTILKECAGSCDEVYSNERAFPPHGRYLMCI